MNVQQVHMPAPLDLLFAQAVQQAASQVCEEAMHALTVNLQSLPRQLGILRVSRAQQERMQHYLGVLAVVHALLGSIHPQERQCAWPAAQESIPQHWRQPVYHAQLVFFQTLPWPVFADIVLQARTER
jgi:hypothetical protein